MTKRENFEFIRTALADNAEIVAFCDHELELLDRKAGYKSGKPTKSQVANMGVKDEILNVLTSGDRFTVTEIAKALGGVYTNQKISALITQLHRDGAVIKTAEKRVTYISLA